MILTYNQKRKNIGWKEWFHFGEYLTNCEDSPKIEKNFDWRCIRKILNKSAITITLTLFYEISNLFMVIQTECRWFLNITQELIGRNGRIYICIFEPSKNNFQIKYWYRVAKKRYLKVKWYRVIITRSSVLTSSQRLEQYVKLIKTIFTYQQIEL